MNRRKGKNTFWIMMMTLMLIFTAGFRIYCPISLISVLSWKFIVEPPREAMTEGGIFPALMGTLLMLSNFAPSGIFTVIWLTHYENLSGWSISTYHQYYGRNLLLSLACLGCILLTCSDLSFSII